MTVVLILIQDIVEVVAFFMFLLLLFILILIARHIRHYLIYRRFTKECDELFTEEFYTRLDTVILNSIHQNEFE